MGSGRSTIVRTTTDNRQPENPASENKLRLLHVALLQSTVQYLYYWIYFRSVKNRAKVHER